MIRIGSAVSGLPQEASGSMEKTRNNGGEWGPWIVHDGKGCPVRQGVIVEVVSVDGFGFAMLSQGQVTGECPSSWDWRHYPELRKIIRYRERRPKGLAMLLDIVRSVDTPRERRPVGTRVLSQLSAVDPSGLRPDIAFSQKRRRAGDQEHPRGLGRAAEPCP